MSREFKSFYKRVGGSEGQKCYYPVRLDSYGCGCQHNCSYCYAKSLLDFRKNWNPDDPSVADIEKIKRKIARMDDSIVRLGGMTDCFQPLELKHRITYEMIKALNENNKHYLIVTKSHIVANDEYIDIMDKELAHIQVSLTSTDDDISLGFERCTPISSRIKTIEKLNSEGFDVSIRLSPFIPQFVDPDVINNIKCDKLLIEFLRVNSWIKKWFDIDYSEYTLKSGGYRHLPLDKKLEYIKPFNKPEMTVCEDVDEHYDYWRDNFNANAFDCCNLNYFSED